MCRCSSWFSSSLTIHLDQTVVATSQFYFPQALNNPICAESPCSDRTSAPVSKAADAIFNPVDEDAVMVSIGDEAGLRASVVVGVLSD